MGATTTALQILTFFEIVSVKSLHGDCNAVKLGRPVMKPREKSVALIRGRSEVRPSKREHLREGSDVEIPLY